MAREAGTGSFLGRLHHVGMVVSHGERAADFYARLWGLGSIRVFDYGNRESRVFGQPADYRLRIALGALEAGLRFELVEVRGGRSVHDEFMASHHEGIDHVAFEVDDLDRAMEEASRAGFALALEPGPKRPNVAYVDAREIGGVFFELYERRFGREAKRDGRISAGDPAAEAGRKTPEKAGGNPDVLVPLLAGARLDHLSMVVHDRDAAVRHLARLGLGPFRTFTFSNEALVYGRPASYVLDIALGALGTGVDLEIIRPVGGANEVHERFLREKGEGIEHVAFEVDDLEGSIHQLEEAGFPVVLTRRRGRPGSVYVDTTAVGGLITELIRKGFKPDDPTTWPTTASMRRE